MSQKRLIKLLYTYILEYERPCPKFFVLFHIVLVYWDHGWPGGKRRSPSLHRIPLHPDLHQAYEANHQQTYGQWTEYRQRKGFFVHKYRNKLFIGFIILLCLDNAQEDKLDDSRGHNDTDHHNVRDGGDLHPNIHRPLPLDPHDHNREAQHQQAGADPHLLGRDGGDNPETG